MVVEVQVMVVVVMVVVVVVVVAVVAVVVVVVRSSPRGEVEPPAFANVLAFSPTKSFEKEVVENQ